MQKTKDRRNYGLLLKKFSASAKIIRFGNENTLSNCGRLTEIMVFVSFWRDRNVFCMQMMMDDTTIMFGRFDNMQKNRIFFCNAVDIVLEVIKYE